VKEQTSRAIDLGRVRAAKAARLARRPALWSGLRHGVAASVEHAGVDFRSDVATIVDVGASRGQFALFAAQRWPQARLICFEPLPQSRELLERVLPSGRAEIRPMALGRDPGELELHVSARDDSSSLLPIGETQTANFPGTQEASRLTVPVGVLSEQITADLARPMLLKIDVQGFELEVLEGAGDALDLVDEIFVECSFVELYTGQALAGEVVAHLHGRGFRLAGVHGMARGADGTSLQADFLFRRDGA
jgi:FkbM family methyltransferase